MDPHRINQTSIVTTVDRQTPKNEFGTVLAQTMAQAVRAGAGIVGGALGSPVVSAAVTAASGITNLGSGGASRPQALAVNASGSTLATPIGGVGTSVASSGSSGTGWDLLAAQQAMQSDSQSFNMQYLGLQDQMQKESREFTAISNIMKVRHDTAKNAISNIH